MEIRKLTCPLIICFLSFMTIANVSCKKEETVTETPQPVVKTLNKSTLTPKKWYSEGSAVIHDFKAGGGYAATGSWSWKNNSDTMEIVTQAGYSPVYWKFHWNTETEMSGERVDQKVTILFKDKAW